MKHEGKSEATDCNIELTPQEVTVGPGETVSVAYSGNVWSWPGCPACIDQVVLGVEDEPFPCVYNGIPGLYPGKTFSGSLSFKAPSTPGTYRMFGIVAMQYTCPDAMEWYRRHPELRFQLGTLNVAPIIVDTWWWTIALTGALAGVIVIGGVLAYNEVVKKRVG